MFFFPISPTRLLPHCTMRQTWRLSYKKNELITLRGHLGSTPILVVSVLLIVLMFSVLFFLCLCFAPSFFLSSVVLGYLRIRPYAHPLTTILFVCVVCVWWWVVSDMYCVFLRRVYPVLLVFLDCPFLIAPSVFSNVYLYTC